VVLVSIPTEQGYYNQSEELTYEADQLLTLTREELAGAFSVREPVSEGVTSTKVRVKEHTFCSRIREALDSKGDRARTAGTTTGRPATNSSPTRCRTDGLRSDKLGTDFKVKIKRSR
jgi:hypothetical protein